MTYYPVSYLSIHNTIRNFDIQIRKDIKDLFLNNVNYDWIKNDLNCIRRDIYKMKLALEHGYSIIRISQEDILNNTLDWKELLNEKIKKYKKPKVIYISKDENLYDNHKITY